MMSKSEIRTFKTKAYHFINTFEVGCFLDSNDYPDKYGNYDALIAFGEEKSINPILGVAFDSLKQYVNTNPDWMFGLLSYDLKNEVEQLNQPKNDQLGFPNLYFFVPQYVLAINGSDICVLKGDKKIISSILAFEIPQQSTPKSVINIKSRIDKTNYLHTFAQLKTHIHRGDIYEINFCQEFFAENVTINPIATYHQLSQLSPSPFGGFLKLNDKYILSSSPERYLAKRENKLISQPIKGTAKRGKTNQEDKYLLEQLRNNEKERAENVMIVDLVRNDLTKCAQKGTVAVDELFGIYSYPQVHQMISTVSCQLATTCHLVDAIKLTFPMGSMTGAPKLRAMQLIDQNEPSKRGAYSGAMGYIAPNGNFDFNVIIRSLLYNHSTRYLSFQVGSAITYQADAEQEYDECLIKASAILKTLGQSD